VVDCDKRFVVAIFSYRQGETMKVGTHVGINSGAFRSGVITAILPKTSDKVDERFAVPFPQTERRELYAIITPDAAAEQDSLASDSSQVAACTVGQWVTVTRDNGIVPSMSVAWRRLGNFVTSWTEHTPSADDPAARRAGIARLEAAFRSPSQAHGLEPDVDWLPSARSYVSR
jgi:hypothetical protein